MLKPNRLSSQFSSMNLDLTFLNSSAANQYQAQMVDSMRVGQRYNLLKGTKSRRLRDPPYISQSALLGGKCGSVRFGGLGFGWSLGQGRVWG